MDRSFYYTQVLIPRQTRPLDLNSSVSHLPHGGPLPPSGGTLEKDRSPRPHTTPSLLQHAFPTCGMILYIYAYFQKQPTFFLPFCPSFLPHPYPDITLYPCSMHLLASSFCICMFGTDKANETCMPFPQHQTWVGQDWTGTFLLGQDSLVGVETGRTFLFPSLLF